MHGACGVSLTVPQGVPKPLSFNLSLTLDPDRWAPFRPKVLHLMGDAEDLGGAKRLAGQMGKRALEGDMRTAPVALFTASTDPRAVSCTRSVRL